MFCSGETMFDPKDFTWKFLCQCRPDMEFDTRNMECRLIIDVDCTYTEEISLPDDLTEEILFSDEPTETSSKNIFLDIIAALKGQAPISQSLIDSTDTHSANMAFCNLIDRYINQY